MNQMLIVAATALYRRPRRRREMEDIEIKNGTRRFKTFTIAGVSSRISFPLSTVTPKIDALFSYPQHRIISSMYISSTKREGRTRRMLPPRS